MSVNNTCDCPNPPGGRAVCEPTQIAMCIVKDGQARQECHTPPTSSNATVVVNWTLTTITGIHHTNDIQVDVSSLQMLLQGTYERSSGELVTFALPQALLQTIQATIAQMSQATRGASASY